MTLSKTWTHKGTDLFKKNTVQTCYYFQTEKKHITTRIMPTQLHRAYTASLKYGLKKCDRIHCTYHAGTVIIFTFEIKSAIYTANQMLLF